MLVKTKENQYVNMDYVVTLNLLHTNEGKSYIVAGMINGQPTTLRSYENEKNRAEKEFNEIIEIENRAKLK
jgi:hypothetical protein